MKNLIWAMLVFTISAFPAPLLGQSDTIVSDSGIVSLFETIIKSQPFISQMKGDTITVDSLPFFWEVSVQKDRFLFGKGGNLLAVEKTAWYSVTVPNIFTILWGRGQSEGTVYTERYNYQLEKRDGTWRVVAIFRKK